MTAHETNLVNQALTEQKEAIIAAIHANRSECLTCVCITKIVREAYVIENLNN